MYIEYEFYVRRCFGYWGWGGKKINRDSVFKSLYVDGGSVGNK